MIEHVKKASNAAANTLLRWHTGVMLSFVPEKQSLALGLNAGPGNFSSTVYDFCGLGSLGGAPLVLKAASK
jgi:hypothetical protein